MTTLSPLPGWSDVGCALGGHHEKGGHAPFKGLGGRTAVDREREWRRLAAPEPVTGDSTTSRAGGGSPGPLPGPWRRLPGRRDPTATEGVRRVLQGLLLPSPQRVAPAPPKSLREARPSSSRSFLECRTRHSGLADDRHQRAGAQLSMIRHRNGDRAVGIRLLHRDVAAAPPDFDETVGSEDAADLATGQHAQSSQLRPQSGSHRLRRAAAC